MGKPVSETTDYEAKESEYRSVGVSEYWIVDLRKSKVLVLLLHDGRYSPREFKGNELIVSQTFPELNLSAEQVLSA